MTKTHFSALVLLATLLLGGPSAAAADEPALPDNVIAQVASKQLTFDAFCRVCVQHAGRDLLESKSGPRAVLDKMCEELMVMQWCHKYKLTVSDQDVNRRWEKLSRQIKTRSGGDKTLRDLIIDRGESVEQFRMKLAHEMRKELVADKRLDGSMPKDDDDARFRQSKLVIAKLMGETKIEYGVPVVGHTTPARMASKDDVCTVNGQPITRAQFGRQLIMRMPMDEVRDWLDKECKIGLMAAEGVAIPEAALKEELARMETLWPVERTVQREVIWTTLSFKDRFKAQWRIPVDHVTKSRFMRGFFGLVRRFRPEVTEDEIRKDFQERRTELYGEHFVVTDISVKFVQRKDPFGRGGRDRAQARREIRDLIAKVSAGKNFEQLAIAIRKNSDPTFTALKVRVFDRRADEMAWERVKDLRDGEISTHAETLSEFHIYRRESREPARTFEELKELLREFRARNKARDWLGRRLQDTKYVRIRWPLPQMGKIQRK